MGWGESFGVVRFDLGPLLQGQTRIPKLKVLIARLLLVLEVCNVKPACRQSWGKESFNVVRFDLGPLLQGQMSIAKSKSAYKSLFLGLGGL